MKFTIFTDTCANLPTSFIKDNDVSLMPLSYLINGKEMTCTDIDNFDGHEYYTSIRNGTVVTTSQINPQKYIDTISPALKAGNDVLFIGISSGISGSFSSAQSAAAQLKKDFPERNIRFVDTLAASLAEGLSVMKAVKCRDNGISLNDTADLLEGMRKRVCQIFTVDDLLHLKKSGRISSATALIGTVLKIKPLLKGDENGKIVSFSKARGRHRAIEALAQKYDELVENPGSQTVCISHADAPEDAQKLKELICLNNKPENVLTVCFEPVTGSHVGPGSLALFFEGGEDVRFK